MRRAIPFESIWLGLCVWMLFTVPLTGWATRQLYQNHLFADHSKEVLGTVGRKFTKVSQGKHGPIYTPYFDYRYDVGNVAVNCEAQVQDYTWQTVQSGQSVPIKYLPEIITDNRLDLPAENQSIWLGTFTAVGMSLVFLMGGTGTLIYVVRRNKINRYLLSNGISCLGKVSSVSYDLVGKGQTKSYYLVFTFQDNMGREITGKTWYLKSGQENSWSSGNPIQVYFDPRNSKRFTVDLDTVPAR